MNELTTLLTAARGGNAEAASTAVGPLFEDLHRPARARLRQHQTMTLLDTTSLVHEWIMKLAGAGSLPVEDRHHFFAHASRVMRSVIVDFARARLAGRRGAGDGLAKVVEMRYFGGHSEAETAEALGVSDRTVRGDWEQARPLLIAAMA